MRKATAWWRSLALLAAAPLLAGQASPRVNFEERLLGAHNRERALVAVPPLQWDEELAEGAAEWARKLSETGAFAHSPDEPGTRIGENIWGGTPDHFTPEQMVGLWIAEKKHFQEGVFPHTSRSGRVEDISHYTQLVWRATGRVGCAASAAGEEEILVCRYSRAGNVIGEEVY